MKKDILFKIDEIPLRLQKAGNIPMLNRLLYRLLRAAHIMRHLGFPLPKARTDATRIVSDKYKFIYVGIPLCGTRTALDLFVRNPQRDFSPISHNEDIGDLLSRNARYSEYFKFTIARNPWSRVVSCYNKKVLNANTFGKINILSKYSGLRPQMSFDEFVQWLCSEEGQDDRADKHWISQTRLLFDRQGRFCCDFVGHLERMQADYHRIFESLGIPSLNLPRLGSSSVLPVKKQYRDFKRYYNKRTASMIADRYQKDVEFFGYEF